RNVLAVATDERDCLGRNEPDSEASVAGIVLDWLGRRLVLHLSCRSLCAVRTQAGLSLPEGHYRRTAAIQDTCPVQDGATPALPRVHHWVLEHATDDGRPFV